MPVKVQINLFAYAPAYVSISRDVMLYLSQYRRVSVSIQGSSMASKIGRSFALFGEKFLV